MQTDMSNAPCNEEVLEVCVDYKFTNFIIIVVHLICTLQFKNVGARKFHITLFKSIY